MIVIDPAKGGSETGASANGIVEKDYTLLISEYIYDRLKQLGADVKIIREEDIYISEPDRANKIKNAYGNNSKVVALSNRLSSRSNEGAEVIYALRNKDTLAESISEELIEAGQTVDKWYQRRSESDTSKDYDDLQKDTGNIETIIVDYGNISNNNDANRIKNNYEKYAEAVVKALANYKGIPYYTPGGIAENYIVKKGDSLYKIANKYGITVSELKNANNLSSNLLNIGDILKIPSKTVDEGSTISEETYVVQKGDSLYSIAKKFNTTVDNLKKLNNLNSTSISIGQVLVVGEIPIESDSNENIYIVVKGDSLYSIANKFNTTVNEIKSLNNLSSNLLSIGQKLKVPRVGSKNVYTVQKGDSLYVIANKFNTTVDNIKSLNNLTSNLLSVGQTLMIPTDNNQNIYIVQRGDSLYSIANKFNVAVNEIKSLNNLSSNLLSIGQELKIPN